MADCVSLSNAAELVEQLRSNPNNVWMVQAADTIEQLMRSNAKLTAMYIEKDETACRLFEENLKLKAERDAAVGDLKSNASCSTCFYRERKETESPCDECPNPDMYLWRGIQKEGEMND